MKYIVIGICIALILLALWLFVRNIRNIAKGKCCEGCKGCSQRDNCSSAGSGAAPAGNPGRGTEKP